MGFKTELTALNKNLNPSELTTEVLDQFRSIIDLDAYAHFLMAEHHGDLHYTSAIALGDDDIVRTVDSFDGEPANCLDYWDPTHPAKGTINSFTESNLSGSSLNDESPLFQALSESGIRHILRLLAYDGRDFIGGLVGFRRAAAGFGAHELRRLREHKPKLQEFLETLNERRRSPARSPVNLLYATKDEPVLEAVSSGVDTWKTDLREHHLERWIEVADSNKPVDEQSTPVLRPIPEHPGSRWRGLLDGYNAEVAQLEGPAGERWLVRIQPAPRPKLGPLAELTERQREVASLAADGKTNREIAGELDITPDTVGDHLSAIYERLELSNRVELANRMAE